MDRHILCIKLRLRDKHSTELSRMSRSVNFVWNYCNETQQRAVRSNRPWLSAFDLQKLTNGASKDLDLHAHTIQRICKEYVTRRTQFRKPWLRWRGAKSLGWVPFNTGHVTFDGASFRFRGANYTTMHLHPDLISGIKIGAGSFNQDSRGRWYLNLAVKVERASLPTRANVGIDLGLRTLAALSTGEAIEAPRFYRQSEAKLATAQRARKSSKRIRAIHAKIANRRKDFLHKASAKIVKEFGLIFVGNISPSKIALSRFAKSSLDAGWADFKRMLSYKAIMHGGGVLEVSERMTSQICSKCGSLPPSRPEGIAGLSKRVFSCTECDEVLDRDVNAARNILRVGQHALSEGARA